MANPIKLKTQNNKNEKSLKLSRRQKWRRNPIPWAVLMLISLVIAGLWVVPDYLSWGSQKLKITEFVTENQTLENQIADQKKTRNQEQEKFDQLAKSTLNVEKQRFPETVNVNQVAKVLEIYMLQLNLSRKTYVDLKTISFSNSRQSESGNFYEFPVTISLSIDENSLRRFIDFLQTGLYDKQLTVDTISPENKGETAALEFLDNNLLPILHIRSINLTEEQKDGTDFPRKIFNAQIQVALFSQSE